MSNRPIIHFSFITVVIWGSLAWMGATAYAAPEPDEAIDPGAVRIEQALLQQLRPAVTAALGEIYQEQSSPFGDEEIVAINERETFRSRRGPLRPTDTLHGAKYFEITIRLFRPNGDQVEVTLKNDTVKGKYYLSEYKITPASDVEPAEQQ